MDIDSLWGRGGKAGNALSETPKGGITLLKVCPQCPPPKKKIERSKKTDLSGGIFRKIFLLGDKLCAQGGGGAKKFCTCFVSRPI